MDNEFKRRLIRHLETAVRGYNRRLHPETKLDVEPLTDAELTEAIDDCIRMLVVLKHDDR